MSEANARAFWWVLGGAVILMAALKLLVPGATTETFAASSHLSVAECRDMMMRFGADRPTATAKCLEQVPLR